MEKVIETVWSKNNIILLPPIQNHFFDSESLGVRKKNQIRTWHPDGIFGPDPNR